LAAGKYLAQVQGRVAWLADKYRDPILARAPDPAWGLAWDVVEREIDREETF